jgi:hypothetical protein
MLIIITTTTTTTTTTHTGVIIIQYNSISYLFTFLLNSPKVKYKQKKETEQHIHTHKTQETNQGNLYRLDNNKYLISVIKSPRIFSDVQSKNSKIDSFQTRRTELKPR